MAGVLSLVILLVTGGVASLLAVPSLAAVTTGLDGLVVEATGVKIDLSLSAGVLPFGLPRTTPSAGITGDSGEFAFATSANERPGPLSASRVSFVLPMDFLLCGLSPLGFACCCCGDEGEDVLLRVGVLSSSSFVFLLGFCLGSTGVHSLSSLDGVGSGTSCFPAVSELLGFLREDRTFRAIFSQGWGLSVKNLESF